MRKGVRSIIYRYLTNADFFNIYKPAETESGGGGQAYIDFPTSAISLANWRAFLGDVNGIAQEQRRQGPSWTVPIHSLGANAAAQQITIYQRRSASISIASQKITSQRGNRVLAWHPQVGFPRPANPRDRHQLPHPICVFLVKTHDGEVWAGWFPHEGEEAIGATHDANNLVRELEDPVRENGDAGLLSFREDELFVETQSRQQPFFTTATQHPAVSEEEATERLLTEDEIDLSADSIEPAVRSRTIQVRTRNQRAVQELKALYGHTCQLTQDKYVFRKRDGVNYTEAHHLIPLGEGGADNPHNIIVVSPLVHRMLHYAEVSPINLDKMAVNADGTAHLDISVNGVSYTVRWHEAHARVIAKYTEAT